ncbi:hypothetical protein SNOG_05776 [Parastagonospora nodorum SN15]|uniref:Uncharacterized protein n=1 Tax=Phaeosphaeria nodorum (strain SN15 / ATCC MYA-4574 / FGSC 10173) TaxID=321614 RepID=Q0UR38_PHANO|nr:hypothetical protein SNOG_05776 [Parastagonospora nodorum SN15]EAT86840.1 hypothetical protein SNOG_05776 [Parastagonospora nodorum SN15]
MSGLESIQRGSALDDSARLEVRGAVGMPSRPLNMCQKE